MQHSGRRRYLNALKAALPCPRVAKRAILRNMCTDVDAYLVEHPDASDEELVCALGAPEVFAEDYLATLGAEQVQTLIRKAKLRKGIVIGVCCSLMALMLAAVISTVVSVYHDTRGGVITVRFVDEQTEENNDPAVSNLE